MAGDSLGCQRCGNKGAAIGPHRRASRNGMRNSGKQGRRRRKRKKKKILDGRQPHLPMPALWMTGHNPLVVLLTRQLACTTTAA
ncbi:hypothetical protein L484_000877 [Morus notabilis]|uniref:Uncharacterized protein n=1 Tax=Morus notabilis TaxID=981085 RepID=W9SMQ2_9ROSA|nr:hypothetical protein L484_000877 [Morus notabilis]